MKIAPFDNGKPRSEDDFIENPAELMGKPYQVQVRDGQAVPSAGA